MAVNEEDRIAIPVKMGELQDLGIKSTNIIQAGENFLDGKFDDVELIDEEEEAAKKAALKVKAKTPNPNLKQPQQKTTVVETPSREISADEAFDLLEGRGIEEEEEEEEENEEAVVVKKKEPEKKEDAIVLKKTEKKVEATPAATTTTETTQEEDDETLYSGIAAEMVTQGIFEAEEDEEGNPLAPVVKGPEEFLQLLTENANRVAGQTIENFLDSKGPEAREIFKAIIVDGVNPREYINRYAAIQDYKNLDLTDELNQEKVVREFYRQAGLDPEDIDRKIKQHKEYSDLATEAERAQKVVVKREEANIKLLADNKVKEDQDKLRIEQEFSSNIAKILNEKARAQDFDGIPLDNKEANETYQDLTIKKYKLADSNQLLTEFEKDILELNRPVNHALKVKMALLLRMLKRDPVLKTLGKKAVSKESSTLFQNIRKKGAKAGVTPTKDKEGVTKEEVDTSKSWFN